MAMETVNAPQIIEHVKKNVTYTPYDTRWVPCSARFVAMGLKPKGTGIMQVYEMKLGELKLVKEVRARPCCGCVGFRLPVTNPTTPATAFMWSRLRRSKVSSAVHLVHLRWRNATSQQATMVVNWQFGGWP